MSSSGLARTSRWVSRSKTLLHFQTKLILTSFSTDTGTADKNNDPGRPGPPPIRVLLTESAGRGVFATRRIGAGELIHTAKPVVAHPSLSKIHSVCYFCLRNLKTICQGQTQAVQFCNEECKEKSKVFWCYDCNAHHVFDVFSVRNNLRYKD